MSDVAGEVILEGQANVLPFELPGYMEGLEDLIIEKAQRYQIDVEDLEAFAKTAALVACKLDGRIRGYWALARIATNPDSLAYQLNDSPYVLNTPEPFDPYSQLSSH